MPRLLKHLLPALVLLAIASAQVFGMGRGFLCDCGGVEKVTLVDHCHGPHSAACHEHEAAAPCQDAEEDHHHDHDDDGDTHEHPALIESLLASVSPALAFSAPVPMVVSLALEEWYSPLLVLASRTSTVAEVSVDSSPQATHRPWPQVLARTVALRI